jgi:hypothetical protein
MRIDDNKILKEKLKVAETRVTELERYIKFGADLNMITPYITKYYTEVFKRVKHSFHHQNDTQTSLAYNNWMELFSAAGIEQTQFELFEIDSKPINTMIHDVMITMGDLSHDDWVTLQTVRKDRNTNGHPRLDDGKTIEAINARWHKHPAYSALCKMMDFLEKQRQNNILRRTRSRRKMF